MAGREPATHAPGQGDLFGVAWVAGTSPAMTWRKGPPPRTASALASRALTVHNAAMTLFGHDLHLSWPLGLAVYFTFWWVALFAVLPLGVRSIHEDSAETPEGVERAAPVAPMMAKKALITSLVAAVAFALLLVVLQFTEG